MRYCFDIDGTICRNCFGKYESAEPIEVVVRHIRNLYVQGHHITLFTARGTTTGLDWRDLTEKQMRDWGVPYHDLLLGKPEADFYIDDKGLSPDQWLAGLSERAAGERIYGSVAKRRPPETIVEDANGPAAALIGKFFSLMAPSATYTTLEREKAERVAGRLVPDYRALGEKGLIELIGRKSPSLLKTPQINEALVFFNLALPNSDAVSMAVEAAGRNVAAESRGYALSRVMWFLYGHAQDDKILFDLFQKYAEERGAFSKTGYNATIWEYALALLTIHQRFGEAETIWNRCRESINPESLKRLLPAAWLAHNLGGPSAAGLQDAAAIYEAFIESRAKAALPRILKNQTLALVGSGPQEVGLGRGPEIDGHDVVVRFHAKLSLSETTRPDYGGKIDIWAINEDGAGPRGYQAFDNLRALFFNNSADRLKLNSVLSDEIPDLARLADRGWPPLTALWRADFQRIIRITDYGGHSSGAMAAAFFKLLHPALSLDGLYGFSFKNQASLGSSRHYFKALGEPEETVAWPYPTLMDKVLIDNVFIADGAERLFIC